MSYYGQFILYAEKVSKKHQTFVLGAYFYAEQLGVIAMLLGRKKIYTDEREIDESNVVDVVMKAYRQHKQISNEIQFLLDYELGLQTIPRPKVIRPEINIEAIDNLASQITTFNTGYSWGSPAMIVQRSDLESPESDAERDGKAIAKLNSIMVNNVHIGCEDQKLARFVEITGIGHRFIDIKSRLDNTGLPFEYATLDSRYAFCVYYGGIGERKMLGVTFSRRKNVLSLTAYTDTHRYDIERGQLISSEINPLGRIPIVETERAIDRTGCFERLISQLDALNTKVSDLSDAIAQSTQEIWWGNDIKFPVDEQGKPIAPKSGQWVLTFTGGDGNNPNIKPLSTTLDQEATQKTIQAERIHILELAKVPIQYSSEGGGSTGIAMDISSGWSSAEVDAMRKQQLVERAKREELDLILTAIAQAPASVVPASDVLRSVRAIDCDFHFNRRKNYDMAVKANTFATYVSHGLHGRHALKEIDAFGDVEQVWEDSKPLIEAYQKATFLNAASEQTDDRIMQDNSDQIENSPALKQI